MLNELDTIFVSQCVSLHAELNRRPWLSESERIAEAVDVAVTAAVAECNDTMVTVDQNELDCADARATARSDMRDDLLYILDNDEDELAKIRKYLEDLTP